MTIIIPIELLTGDYETWEFNCPHCSNVVVHIKGDLDFKKCIHCGKTYGCDDIGSMMKVGDETMDLVYNRDHFELIKGDLK